MRIVGQAGKERVGLGRQDRGDAAELVQQLVDDRTGVWATERL